MTTPRHATPRHATPRRAWISLLFLFLTNLPFLASDGVAQTPGSCIDSGYYANRASKKKYKVNTSNLSLMGFSTDEGLGATMLGADQWNEHANVGQFQYVGTTSENTLPATALECAQQGIDYSLVRFTNDCAGSGGIGEEMCDGTQFRITIRRRTSLCGSTRTFGNGAIDDTTSLTDLPGLMAHEFGHILGIDHGEAGEAATMMSLTSSVRKANHRQLYEYDLKCAPELAGTRSLSAYRRTHASNGTFSSATLVKSGVAKAHAGYAMAGVQTAAYHRGAAISWDKGADGSYVNLSNPSSKNATGFLPRPWRETSGIDRVFYSYWNDYPTQYDYDSVHLVRQIRSSNEFSSQTAGYLYHCSNGACSSVSALRSAGIVSVGYESSPGLSVFAWIHQDKADDGAADTANEIRIAVGADDNDTLNQPTTVVDGGGATVRSAIAPSVACKTNFSGSYDCVLVYVPIDDLTLRIAARRFAIILSGGRYVPSFDTSEYLFPSTSKSSGPVAVWWNSGTNRFYAAWRRAVSGQDLGVRSSTNGTTWDYESAGMDVTYIAPSVMSTYSGSSNVLVYAK